MSHVRLDKQVPCISGCHNFSGGVHCSHISKILATKRTFIRIIVAQMKTFIHRPTILSRVIAKEVLLKVTARILKVPSITPTRVCCARWSGGMSCTCLPKPNRTRHVTAMTVRRRDTYGPSSVEGPRWAQSCTHPGCKEEIVIPPQRSMFRELTVQTKC